jgi:hypothetical protein
LYAAPRLARGNHAADTETPDYAGDVVVVVVVETDQLLPLPPPRDQHANQDDGDGNQHPVLERHTQEREALCQPSAHVSRLSARHRG